MTFSARKFTLTYVGAFVAIGAAIFATVAGYDWAAAVAGAVMLAAALGVFMPTAKRFSAIENELSALTLTDPLTGCRNQRGAFAGASALLAYFARHGGFVSTILLDVDEFAELEERGDGARDAVLQSVLANTLPNIRASDLVGRIEGGRFVVFLPDTAIDQASAVAEKMRDLIGGSSCIVGGAAVRITASFGVACARPTRSTTPATLMTVAEQALDDARRQGGNCVRWRPVVEPRESRAA
jgi:two-component system chemotaxis response regulator CheY